MTAATYNRHKDPINDYREQNAQLFEQLMSTNPQIKAAAVDSINDFIRAMAREVGVARSIIPLQDITPDELDIQASNVELSCKVVFKEPMAPGAIAVAYDTGPDVWQIHGQAVPATFARIVSPAFARDTSKLRNYRYDICQVIADHALLDIMAQEDSRFFSAVSTAIGTTAGAASPMTGEVQYWSIPGGVTRDSFVESLKIIPSTQTHFEPKTVVVNNVTVKDFRKWGHDEYGGPRSQDILARGNFTADFEDLTWLVTIKRHLVPDGEFFLFADPEALGKNYRIQDVTMYVENKAWNIMWYDYEELATVIVNAGSIGRANTNA